MTAWVFVLLAVAAFLRAISLGRGEIWHDEVCALLMTIHPDGIWSAAANPLNSPDGGNPPFYYALLAVWTKAFGLGAAALRSLSSVLGVAQVAATGWAAQEWRGSRSAVLASMAVAAASPLLVFYSTETRAYIPLLLFLTLSVGAFARAFRTGRPVDWALHAGSLLLACYTHNLAVPMAAAFWGAAFVLRATRLQWTRLAVAHAAVILGYGPWVPIVFGQTGSDAHAWIRLFWEKESPLLLVPKTVEAFLVGGRLPAYLSMPESTPWVRALAIAGFAVAGFAAPGGEHRRRLGAARPSATRNKAKRVGASQTESPPPPSQIAASNTIGALLVFFAVPLIFLLGYSFAKSPLYLVGRYDLAAFPAFALIAGRMFSAAMSRGIGWRWGFVAWGATITVLAHGAALTAPKFTPSPGPKAARGALLSQIVEPEDRIVCTGFTTTEVMYQFLLQKRAVNVETFPTVLRSHLGWYDPGGALAAGEAAVRADARRLFEPATGQRIVLVYHATPARGAHETLMNTLLEEAEQAGWTLTFPAGREEEAQRLGVGVLLRRL